MSQQPDFIDVSHWQGAIDWKAVAGSGILGAIAKCTDGQRRLDPNYLKNRLGALANGLAFCPYHYLQRGEAGAQMDWFLSQAQLRQGERVVLDYEEADPAVRITDLQAAIFAIRKDRPDLQITVYGASKLTEDVNKLEDTSWLQETSLWAARYSTVNQPVVAKAWPYWSAWQFTDEGRIAGIDGEVDLSTFNGSPEACLAWFGPATEAPIPVPEPPVEMVVEEKPKPIDPAEHAVAQILRAFGREVAVSIEEDGTVSFWVDGQPWHDAKA
jgi:lysozyme